MAVNQSITKKFTPNYKEVSYLSKNFPDFRQNLIEFAKSYYPQTYSDFNEASPGMMFIEMASYVGDVLSFYIDNQFKENLLAFAQERKNIINISQAFGYKPRLTAPATVQAIMYQMVPALPASENFDPDDRFFLKILRNSKFSTNTADAVSFRSMEDVDFANPTDREIRVFSRNPVDNTPTMYVVSKKIKLIAADIKTTQFTFGSPQKFTRVQLSDPNIISVINVVDSDGNIWDEVDFLGQDVVIDEKDVSVRNDSGFLASGSLVTASPNPTKIAVFRRKPRRFVTRINDQMQMEMWFGSGITNLDDEIFQLNSNQIANTKYDQRIGNASIDPTDFLESDAFGLAPANTTLTVSYWVGGGVESNAPSNTITTVDSLLVSNRLEDYPNEFRPLYNQILGSVAINNEEPATGGGDPASIEEMRQNALAFFNAQNRVVTDKDYLVRTLSLPPQFGSIAKAFILREEQIIALGDENIYNLTVNRDSDPYNNRIYVNDPVVPHATNVYVLGYNANRNLTTLNTLVKQNLAKYLEQFRVLTDDINIIDAFIVNIGVEFDIVVYRNYNMNDVLARTIDAVKDFFDVDRWQINQPIIMNDLRLTIGSVEGVRTVPNVRVFNKYFFRDGRDYQEYRYPISEATIDDVIYPSLDPCIFELRYPDTDIIGHARQ
jgi:hypothetical protein